MKIIDHLVYCVPDLNEAILNIKKVFGVEPTYGGKHLEQGTHNALINVGNQCYLELLAPDPENRNVDPPRWMGIDLISKPRLTRWGIKSNTMAEDLEILRAVNPQLARRKIGMRKKIDGTILNWELSVPLAHPQVEAVPFLIDWKDSDHPTESLPQTCELINFTIHHPEPRHLYSILKSLDIKSEVKQEKEIALVAEFQTPNGRKILS